VAVMRSCWNLLFIHNRRLQVERHLCDNDVVVLRRPPVSVNYSKMSLMGHRVKVQHFHSSFQLNPSVSLSFRSDAMFDFDVIHMHVPQTVSPSFQSRFAITFNISGSLSVFDFATLLPAREQS
jgi:DNA-directed RNA polymerase beta' subunit